MSKKIEKLFKSYRDQLLHLAKLYGIVEIKSYAINNIETANGLSILLFVTVLQKENEIYECQEYQTIDKSIDTLDMQLICKQLVQPYERGLGT